MPQSPLGTTVEPSLSFAFDRRRDHRAPASGFLQAVLATGRDMPRVTRLGLVNASRSGVCFQSDAPIEPGARLSMRIDPVHGNWMTGTVVRCRPVDDRYELGVAYERSRSAA